jgi:recombination protein RecT
MGSQATALVRVEESPVAIALNEQSQALLELLPDASAVTRFKRVVLQACAKNPDLLACTPDSVVTAVFEAAAMGLEPTGAAGGAHLVPFNVKVSRGNEPDRWEKRAQLIPDFRGVVAMVTRPAKDGTPSDVLSIEARTVKEGDEFAYTEGIAASLVHVPTLSASRSSKPTSHVYAIARMANGAEPKFDVMDHAEVERIRAKGKQKKGINPWDTDWDEMAKKTVVKRLAKLLPVRPEVRSILVREDELEAPAPVAPQLPAAAPATARLAARLRPSQPAPAAPDPEPVVVVVEAVDPLATAPEPSWPDAMDSETFAAFLAQHSISTEYAKAVATEMFPDMGRMAEPDRAKARSELAAALIAE